jgi:hypothetical protein
VTIFLIILVVFLLGAAVLAIVNARLPPAPARQATWSHVTKSVAGAWERSKICGNYQGRPVEIFVSDHGHELPLYFYHLRIKVPLKGFDWTICFDTTNFLDPTKSWHIKTGNEPLKTRLADAGAIALVSERPEHPEVSYRADKGTLELQFYVDDDKYVPTAEDLQAQLNLMIRLADLNETLNVW